MDVNKSVFKQVKLALLAGLSLILRYLKMREAYKYYTSSPTQIYNRVCKCMLL